MSRTSDVPQITLRIPGEWSAPDELMERLPEGVRISPESLRLPDGFECEFIPLPPDDQFPQIFESSCRRQPTEDELAVVGRYQVNVCLKGPGGSIGAALSMMRAGSAIVQAGGAGVFIDNSALAHGGSEWIAMTEDGGPDAISFAFATIIQGRETVYTMGMHVMGYSDLSMRTRDIDEDGDTIVDIIRYVCRGDHPVDVGHVLADEAGPRFQVVSRERDEFEAGSPMHNPYGRLKIVAAKDVAQGN